MFRGRGLEIINKAPVWLAHPDLFERAPSAPDHGRPALRRAVRLAREGNVMAKLSEPEIVERMPNAKGWERHGDMLVRSWQFPSFRRALEFVNQVAAVAETQAHHPEIVLSYRVVRVELSTHAEGGLTDLDFNLATQINTLPSDR